MTSATFHLQSIEKRPSPLGWIERRAKSMLIGKLRSIKGASLVLCDAEGVTHLGDESADTGVRISIHSPKFYTRAITGGNLGVAKSYLDGDWDCKELTTLFRVMIRALGTTDRLSLGLGRVRSVLGRMWHGLRRNTLKGSQRNIEDHYDLGNDFFKKFLDSTMSYSCGIYESAESTLEQASNAKIDRLCRIMNLSSDDHLLEIGTGWGGLAVYAAKHFGCRVTSTTISKEQFRLARERVETAGLQDRVTLLLNDYRELEGRFDKLVSVEMIEAVGHRFLPTFFRRCSELLKADGAMVLQAITMPDHRYAAYLKRTDFIQRYVFPGSCVPAMSSMTNAMAQSSDFKLVKVDEFGTHYAQTLRDWRENFLANVDGIKVLGYPDRLLRMWNYYLCYCEAGFDERYIGLSQMVLARPECRFNDPAVNRSQPLGVC